MDGGVLKETFVTFNNVVYSWVPDLVQTIEACLICAEEVRKECMCIKAKDRKKQKITTQATESLSDKCIKVIVNDPGLLLVASTQYQFPDETVWKRMHELAPDKLANELQTFSFLTPH